METEPARPHKEDDLVCEFALTPAIVDKGCVSPELCEGVDTSPTRTSVDAPLQWTPGQARRDLELSGTKVSGPDSMEITTGTGENEQK